MPRSSMSMSFPPFAGTVRQLVLANIRVFFAIQLLQIIARGLAGALLGHLMLQPAAVAHGEIWQLVTYSYLHFGILDILFTMLTLWFCGSLLEACAQGSRWLRELYFTSAIGGAVLASVISFTPDSAPQPLFGE